MADHSKTPESEPGEPKPPKIKAEDNPWYLLATLCGVPEPTDFELQGKNRIAWNRYFAARLPETIRRKLIEEEAALAEELTPFSPKELREIATAFNERCKALANKPPPPASDTRIDFSNVEFEQAALFGRYLFSGRASFDGATFSDEASFDGTTFSGWTSFDGATFSGIASFRSATFSDWANFDGATFSDEARFGGATFSDVASFRGAIFRWADFDGAIFSKGARLDYTTFSGLSSFDGATFSDWATFGSATFSDEAKFGGVTFSGWASFVGATFSGVASFSNATFGGKSIFVNAEMKGVTSFERTIFKTEPPKFFGAQLHQGTVWRGIAWPPKPQDKYEAGSFIDAYACLKLEMDRLKKHEDELDFFALEMQSRRVLLGSWRWGLPIAIYGLLSDYGRSYLRPLGALFVVVAIGTGAFSYFDGRTYGEALGLSVANSLNVFGFRKDFDLAIDTPLVWLEVWSATQTILGAILLFLFGLGVRNKFRMK